MSSSAKVRLSSSIDLNTPLSQREDAAKPRRNSLVDNMSTYDKNLPAELFKFKADKKHYKTVRRLDVLDLGTALGKHSVMHQIDFLRILPRGEDEYSRERQKQRAEIARKIDYLTAQLSQSHKQLDEDLEDEELGSSLDDRYEQDMHELRRASKNLAHFYAAVSHVLDKNPSIAQAMDCVVGYEIEAPFFPND